MPDFGSATFSQTDSSNNSGTMPSWSGSAAPSTLDDAGRALQGAVTREWNWRSFTLTATGTADAKVLTYSVAPAAYYNGQRFAFIANTTNTASATLNVNSLGAKTIKKLVAGVLTDLSASDMVAGIFVEVAYNTANDCFVWVNQGIATSSPNTWSAVQTFTASPIISVTDDTNAALRVTQLGTGNAILVEDSANPDSSPFVVTAAGDVGIGTTSPSSYGKFAVLGGDAAVVKTSGIASQAVTSNTVTNSIKANDAGVGTIGTDSNHALWLMTNNTARVTLDTSGTLLAISSGGIGYGTGSGGTVTQITSKSTGVTLNKTNGQIVTHNANVSATVPVSFVVTNSTVAATDTVIVHRSSGGTNASYVIGCDSVSAGSFRVYISNISGAGLAEALTLNFAVIKAVTS